MEEYKQNIGDYVVLIIMFVYPFIIGWCAFSINKVFLHAFPAKNLEEGIDFLLLILSVLYSVSLGFLFNNALNGNETPPIYSDEINMQVKKARMARVIQICIISLLTQVLVILFFILYGQEETHLNILVSAFCTCIITILIAYKAKQLAEENKIMIKKTNFIKYMIILVIFMVIGLVLSLTTKKSYTSVQHTVPESIPKLRALFTQMTIHEFQYM